MLSKSVGAVKPFSTNRAKQRFEAAADDVNSSVEDFELRIDGFDWDPVITNLALTAPKDWAELNAGSAAELVHILRDAVGITGDSYDMGRVTLPFTRTADVWAIR